MFYVSLDSSCQDILPRVLGVSIDCLKDLLTNITDPQLKALQHWSVMSRLILDFFYRGQSRMILNLILTKKMEQKKNRYQQNRAAGWHGKDSLKLFGMRIPLLALCCIQQSRLAECRINNNLEKWVVVGHKGFQQSALTINVLPLS